MIGINKGYGIEGYFQTQRTKICHQSSRFHLHLFDIPDFQQLTALLSAYMNNFLCLHHLTQKEKDGKMRENPS